jgi:hypothetical protein
MHVCHTMIHVADWVAVPIDYNVHSMIGFNASDGCAKLAKRIQRPKSNAMEFDDVFLEPSLASISQIMEYPDSNRHRIESTTNVRTMTRKFRNVDSDNPKGDALSLGWFEIEMNTFDILFFVALRFPS